jgi:hypothetical protein
MHGYVIHMWMHAFMIAYTTKNLRKVGKIKWVVHKLARTLTSQADARKMHSGGAASLKHVLRFESSGGVRPACLQPSRW